MRGAIMAPAPADRRERRVRMTAGVPHSIAGRMLRVMARLKISSGECIVRALALWLQSMEAAEDSLPPS